MIYVWIGIILTALFLIGRIIRWWNLPAVVEARRKRTDARQKARTDRLLIRRRGRKVDKPVENKPEAETKPVEEVKKRRRWFGRRK